MTRVLNYCYEFHSKSFLQRCESENDLHYIGVYKALKNR